MVDVRGLKLTIAEQKQLKLSCVGGVILFTRNYNSTVQVKELISSIKKINPQLLIAIDQEGGAVQRFTENFTKIPAMSKLGQMYDKNADKAIKKAFSYGFILAYELLQIGIDLSLTPVLDLNYKNSTVIGERAFHADPYIVIKLATSLMKGIHQTGMKCVGKHFPGHGYVTADSHIELPIDKRPMSSIKKDLIAFQGLINKGINAVMTAHIKYNKIDENPASFSSTWLQQILRSQMGFNGVIFSDDLQMQGVSFINDMTTRIKKALSAGCDMVLVLKHDGVISKAFKHDWEANDKPSLMKAQYAKEATQENYQKQLAIVSSI